MSEVNDNGKEISRATAILPFLSLLNHSCNFNVVTCSIERSIAIYAVDVIKKGEQVFISYGSWFVLQTKEQRRLALEPYYFVCSCIACKEDWPEFKRLPSILVIKCFIF